MFRGWVFFILFCNVMEALNSLRNLEPEAARHLGGQTLPLHIHVWIQCSVIEALCIPHFHTYCCLYCIIDWGGFQCVDRRKKLGQV